MNLFRRSMKTQNNDIFNIFTICRNNMSQSENKTYKNLCQCCNRTCITCSRNVLLQSFKIVVQYVFQILSIEKSGKVLKVAINKDNPCHFLYASNNQKNVPDYQFIYLENERLRLYMWTDTVLHKPHDVSIVL